MPYTVHVASEAGINSVPPYVKRYRHDGGIPTNVLQFRERGLPGYVECSGHGLSACGLDLIDNSACGCLIEIRCGNLHAFLGKADRCGAADVPGRRSGNDGYPVPKSSHRLALDFLASSISVLPSVFCDSVLRDQHHTESCFALHHVSVSISSLFERSCLDHRPDFLQYAERESVLLLDRGAGQRAVDRAPSENQRERTQLNLVGWHAYHDELAAGRKSGHEWSHTITTGSRCENRSGPAHTLQYRCGIFGGSIDLDVRGPIFGQL